MLTCKEAFSMWEQQVTFKKPLVYQLDPSLFRPILQMIVKWRNSFRMGWLFEHDPQVWSSVLHSDQCLVRHVIGARVFAWWLWWDHPYLHVQVWNGCAWPCFTLCRRNRFGSHFFNFSSRFWYVTRLHSSSLAFDFHGKQTSYQPFAFTINTSMELVPHRVFRFTCVALAVNRSDPL